MVQSILTRKSKEGEKKSKQGRKKTKKKQLSGRLQEFAGRRAGPNHLNEKTSATSHYISDEIY